MWNEPLATRSRAEPSGGSGSKPDCRSSREFLSFLAARVEDAATAEDILQAAYVKAVEHGSEIRQDESAVAWFYRILRNAVADHYRRSASRERALQGFADQSLLNHEAGLSHEAKLKRTACACVGDVVRELKSEYRAAIEQVDLGGVTVEDFARSQHAIRQQCFRPPAPGAQGDRQKTDDRLRYLRGAQVP